MSKAHKKEKSARMARRALLLFAAFVGLVLVTGLAVGLRSTYCNQSLATAAGQSLLLDACSIKRTGELATATVFRIHDEIQPADAATGIPAFKRQHLRYEANCTNDMLRLLQDDRYTRSSRDGTALLVNSNSTPGSFAAVSSADDTAILKAMCVSG